MIEFCALNRRTRENKVYLIFLFVTTEYMYARCNVSPDPNLSDDEKNLITGVVQLRQKVN